MSVTEAKDKTYSALSEQSEKALSILDFSISELDPLKMPSAGDNSFTVQTSKFRKKVQYVEGIVIAQNDVRSYKEQEKDRKLP